MLGSHVCACSEGASSYKPLLRKYCHPHERVSGVLLPYQICFIFMPIEPVTCSLTIQKGIPDYETMYPYSLPFH